MSSHCVYGTEVPGLMQVLPVGRRIETEFRARHAITRENRVRSRWHRARPYLRPMSSGRLIVGTFLVGTPAARVADQKGENTRKDVRHGMSALDLVEERQKLEQLDEMRLEIVQDESVCRHPQAPPTGCSQLESADYRDCALVPDSACGPPRAVTPQRRWTLGPRVAIGALGPLRFRVRPAADHRELCVP